MCSEFKTVMSFQLPKFFANRAPVTEAEHQLVVMTYCRTHGDDRLKKMFHVPNGGGRSKREAAELKAIGVKPGVSDLFLPVMANGKGGLWLEMKAANGVVSPEQKEWLEAMQKGGYEAHVCYGYQEAIAAIENYLGGEWPDVDMTHMEERMSSGRS